MSKPYFLVHSVEIKDGVALVDGRLGEEALKINHVFSLSFPDVDAWQRRDRGNPCSLVVHGIEAYRRRLEELSPGMTARLSVFGGVQSTLASVAVLE